MGWEGLGKVQCVTSVAVPAGEYLELSHREEACPQELRARCHLYLGVGHYLQSYEVGPC